MANLQFKDYVWPQDPSSYSRRVWRTPVFEVYENGTYGFLGVSEVKRTITGTGVFSGPEAEKNYQQLENLVSKIMPGDLVHPVWGTLYGYLLEVKMTQEPSPGVIHYQFSFTGCDGNNNIPV